VDKFPFNGGIFQQSVFSNMYHHGPSDNGSRIENCNNKHLLKEDFSTSVNGLHAVKSQISFVVKKQWGQKRLHHNISG
jgi:hypothetical protein